MHALIAAALLVYVAALATMSAQEKTAWDGVYAAPQAARGEARYAEACATCHGADMAGGPGVPGVTGIEFMFKYNGKTVADLFDYLTQNMPPGQQGSLTDAQYLDLTAAILKGNGFPQGAADLPPDRASLAAIRLTRNRP
jgi:mono/diheme cytochrome c family protein